MMCRECPKRYVGCHSTCGDYISYRINRDISNAAIRSKNECRTTTGSMIKHQTDNIKFRQRVKAWYLR